MQARSVRLVAVLVAALSLAAGPAVQELLARDGKAQHGLYRENADELRTLAQAVAQQAPIACTAGFAGPYPCENVDLLSIVPIAQIGAGTGSDVWGWTSADGREIAITTTTFGAAFVDVTDPENPVVLGRLQQAALDSGVIWRDVKVFADHAFLVSEHDTSGMLAFDMNRLGDVTTDQGFLDPDVQYGDFANAHNIAINEETGFAYVVGTDTCGGGLHMVDLNDPANPTFAGCFDEDGYTHDVQCVVYRGRDQEFVGREICFASNEDTVTVVDVTDKDRPEMLSRSAYDGSDYTHQGWLTDDHGFFIFGDELDEDGSLSSNPSPGSLTQTYIIELTDLREPEPVLRFEHETTAIDHNLYVEDGYVWQANYMAGLRVFDFDDDLLRQGKLDEVAFFDVDPGPDLPEFAGAWTVYPFFDSGTLVLSSFDQGLFVLRANLPVKEPTEPAPAPEPEPEPAPAPEVEPTTPLPATGGGLALGGLAVAGLGALARRRR